VIAKTVAGDLAVAVEKAGECTSRRTDSKLYTKFGGIWKSFVLKTRQPDSQAIEGMKPTIGGRSRRRT
jgi:hypothetical protein